MNYNFNSIAGYETEKQELKRLCEIFINRKEYLQRGAKLPKGIIFYGSAGTGKTLFAKVMANACGLKIFKIDLGNVEDEFAVCKQIKKVFASAAKRHEPSMIFFDEIDKVLPNAYQDYVTDRAKTVLAQLLTLIDGMDSAGNIVFTATCNDYSALPETLIRPGRIDKKVCVGLPDYESRVAILKAYAKKSPCKFELDAEEIAKLCQGFSCAALETLVNECILQSDERGIIGETLVKTKIAEILNEDIPRPKQKSYADTINACRNIGSFIVARSINDGDYELHSGPDTVCNTYLNAVINEYDGDYDEYDDYDDDDYDDDYDEDDSDDDSNDESQFPEIYTKTDCTNAVCAILGGYAAEEVIFHKVYDNVSNQLWTMDRILQGMSRDGLLGLDLWYSPDRNRELRFPDEYLDRIHNEFQKIISECHKRARDIIEANEDLIKKLIPILVEKETICKDDCEKILQQLGGIKR